jgi:hypothetical protein
MQVQPASLLFDISQARAGHRERRDASWFWYANEDNGDTEGALPFAVDELFRGQTARHVPKIPSIARGLKTSDLGEMWRAPIADQRQQGIESPPDAGFFVGGPGMAGQASRRGLVAAMAASTQPAPSI